MAEQRLSGRDGLYDTARYTAYSSGGTRSWHATCDQRMNYMPTVGDWSRMAIAHLFPDMHRGRDCHKVLRGRLQELADKFTVEISHFSVAASRIAHR